jgi:hypothetical protein
MDHHDRGLITIMCVIGIIIIILLLTRNTGTLAYRYSGNGLTASALQFDDFSVNQQPSYGTTYGTIGTGYSSGRALSGSSSGRTTTTTTTYYNYPQTQNVYYSEGCAPGYLYSETTGQPCYQAQY